MPVYSILIVDDERIIREGIAKLMPWQELKIDTVLQAKDGRQALEMAREAKPEIILTDICMPDMDGLEFIRALLDLGLETDQVHYEPRVLILTGHDRFVYAQQSCKLGAKDLLLKPVDESVLVSVLARQVEAIDRIRDEQQQKRALQQQLDRQLVTARSLRLEQITRQAVEKGTLSQEDLAWLTGNESRLLGTYRLGFFLVDGLAQLDADDRDLAQFGLSQLCRQMIEAAQLGLCVYLPSESGFCCWFFLEDDDRLIETCDRLCLLARQEYQLPVKAGLSRVAQSIQDSRNCWLEVQAALNQGQAIGAQVYVADDQTRTRLMLKNRYGLKRNHLQTVSEDWQLQEDIAELTELLPRLQEPADWVRKECGELALQYYWRQLRHRRQDGTAASLESFDQFLQDLASLDAGSACNRLSRYIQESQLFSESPEAIHPVVLQAVQYIKSHLKEELSVAGLAETLHVSPNYLSRIFRQDIGEGCNEYIVRKRMELAQSLLTKTSLRTYEIAEQVGYQDKNYFSLTFRKFSGQSPTDYRKSNQIF